MITTNNFELRHRVRLQICKVGVALVLVCYAGIAPVFSFASEHSAEISYEQSPGKLYSIGTHKLHLWCEGEGQPVVLVDTGLGSSMLEWMPIMREVSAQTKVCAYDRGGYAWSEKGPSPRTSTRIARELDLLLSKANVQGPFVLIGHSFGGFNVQQLARWRPDEIVGMVLVDASHVNQFELFEALTGVSMTPSNRSFHLFQSPVPDNISADLYELVRYFSQTRKMYETVKDEMFWFRASGEQVKRFNKQFQFPLTVISREQKTFDNSSKRAQKEASKEALWDELQTDLMRLSTSSRRVVAQDSGHYIHLDRPDIVQDAVLDMIDRFRQNKLVTQTASTQ